MPGSGWAPIRIHQPRDQYSEIKHAENGFHHRERSDRCRDGGDACRTKGCHGREAVINEVELVGDRVEVGQRVEIERFWLNGSRQSIDAGKSKPYQQVNTKRPENCFRIRLVLGKDAAEDNHHNKYIKHKAEDDVENGKKPWVRLTKSHVLQYSGDGQQERNEQECSAQADRVHSN